MSSRSAAIGLSCASPWLRGATRLRTEDLMIMKFDDNEARLLYAVILEKAQEHFSYATTSEVAERLYKLAIRFESLRKTTSITTA
jgi:hypothetical protein